MNIMGFCIVEILCFVNATQLHPRCNNNAPMTPRRCSHMARAPHPLAETGRQTLPWCKVITHEANHAPVGAI